MNRKVAEGQNKMLVMSSMRNQFILRIFACVPDNSVYQKNYVHALASTIEIAQNSYAVLRDLQSLGSIT